MIDGGDELLPELLPFDFELELLPLDPDFFAEPPPEPLDLVLEPRLELLWCFVSHGIHFCDGISPVIRSSV